MTGQCASKVESIRAFAAEGLTALEIAERLDICQPYVKVLAKNHHIVLAPKPRVATERAIQLIALAAQGLTRKEACEQLGLQYVTVAHYALEYQIQFKRSGLATATVRTRQMAALYQSGKTLQEIGTQYGITRERVRQLITKFHGLRATDGGKHKTGQAKRAVFEAKRNAASLKRWGCNWDQYVALRNMRKPTRCWHAQRQNAAKRGIGWELNLWQWWSIWQQSGKWAQRGRGRGYMMCRKGDLGPYAIDNVFIATGCENSSNQARNKSGLPIGVRKNKRCRGYTAVRSINGKTIRLGSHPTPELAHAAYLACEPQQKEVAA